MNGHADGCPNSGDRNGNAQYDYAVNEIRCNFCGTINPAGARKCSSCNASLEGSVIRNRPNPGNARNFNHREYNPYSEMRPKTEYEESTGNHAQENNCCPHCGYPLRKGASSCPNPECPTHNSHQKKTEKENVSQNKAETVGAWNATPCFRIGPCGKDGSISNAKEYETEEITLGRDELLPGNNVISHKHIHLINEDGQWYVEDVSSTHQTFISVKGKMPIENGDVLVLGNKFFRFVTE